MDTRDVRRFSVALGVFVAGVWSMVVPWLAGHGPWWPGMAAGVLLGTWGWARPAAMAPVARGLHRMARALGHLNGMLLLGAVFVLVIVPLGLARRLLVRRRAPRTDSYYEVPEPRRPDDMTRMF